MNDNSALLHWTRHEPTANLRIKQALQISASTKSHRSPILKWWPETIGWIISVLIVTAIVVVLHAYDGVVTARWQSQMPVTLNAFLSLLVTFLYMALMVPIPKCIAQLKWNHYSTSRPLSDIELFDEASRTVWGSAVLLVSRPNRLLAALGAFLTLAVAGVGPFVQQILSQEVVSHRIDDMTPTAPVWNWTSTYSGALTMAYPPNPDRIAIRGIMDQHVDEDAFDAAFYTGLMAPVATDFPVVPRCTAANCTWSPYWTLVVESECQNITDQLNSSSWTLPNSLEIEFNSYPIYNTITTHPSVAFPKRGYLISNFFFTASEAVPGEGKSLINHTATVLECILQLRARKVRAEYKNGQWSETQISPSVSDNNVEARACSPSRRLMASGMFDYPKTVDPTGEFFPNASGEDPLVDLWFSGNGGAYEAETSTCNITINTDPSDEDEGPTLVFPALQLLNVAWRLIYIFGRDTMSIDSTGGLSGTAGGKVGGILNYLVSIVSTNPRTQASLDKGHNITFEERINNIAKSLTYNLRTSYFEHSIVEAGEAYRDTVIYRVDWYWIAVPASLVLLTFVLLALTILDTFGKDLEKRTDSSLAVMVLGCDENVRRTVAMAGSNLKTVAEAAKSHYVRLGADHVLTSTEIGERGRRCKGLE